MSTMFLRRRTQSQLNLFSSISLLRFAKGRPFSAPRSNRRCRPLPPLGGRHQQVRLWALAAWARPAPVSGAAGVVFGGRPRRLAAQVTALSRP